MTVADFRLFTHYVNQDGIITQVNDDWLDFAWENDWHVDRASIIGRSMWDYIAGEEVRHLYFVIMEKARNTGKTIRIPYRCDSSALKRYMTMEILYDTQRCQFCFSNRLLKTERQLVNVLEINRDRSQSMITICSWCKNVRTKDGLWLPVEEAIHELGLMSELKLPHLTHAACPECKRSVLES